MSTNHQIDSYLRTRVKDKWLGAYPADELLHNPPQDSYLVVNTSDSGESGTHWQAVYAGDFRNEAWFYDAFGMRPDDANMILHTDTHFKPYMERLGKRNGNGYRWSTKEMNVFKARFAGNWLCTRVCMGSPQTVLVDQIELGEAS